VEKNISVLRGTTLFQDLSNDNIAKILKICRTVRFPKDTTIMKEGDVGETIIKCSPS